MTYEFKCTTCASRHSFSNKVAATAAGWALAEVWSAGKVKYFVACPKDAPALAGDVAKQLAGGVASKKKKGDGDAAGALRGA